MKKVITLILAALIFLNCSDDNDDGIDCALFDPAFPSLFMRIVDSNGVNLIENETIDPDNITVEGNFPNAGFRFVPADEFAGPDSEIREFDNSLNLSVPNESSFQFTIDLDGFKTINVGFEAEETKIPCDIIYFNPTDVTFDGKSAELTELSSLQFLVIIEL